MPEAIKVVSQNPPGGRCTLYALYAAELHRCLGLSQRVIHSEHRDAHGNGFPSLLINDAVLKPSDGVILSPQDICAGLAQAAVASSAVPDLVARLEAIQERFMQGI